MVRQLIPCICWAFTIAQAGGPCLAQTSISGALFPAPVSTSSPPGPNTEVDLNSKRQEISEQVRVAQRKVDSFNQNTAEPEPISSNAARELELVKQLEVVVAQLQSITSLEDDLKTQLSDLSVQIESVSQNGPQEEAPYSFLLLDQFQDQLTSLQRRTATVEASVASATEVALTAKASLESREQEVLQATELLNNATDNVLKRKASSAVKLAEIEANIAGETLALRKQEQTNEELLYRIHQRRIELLSEKVKWLHRSVVFSKEDLQTQILELDKREADLKREIRDAEAELQQAEREWSRARQQLDDASARDPVLVELTHAKQIERQSQQQRLTILNACLQRIGIDREIWNHRYHVIRNTVQPSGLITWTDEVQLTIEQLTRDKAIAQIRLDELRQDLASLDKRIQSISDDDAELRRRVTQQRDGLMEMVQAHNTNIVSIESTNALATKLLEEIEGNVALWAWDQWGETVKHYVEKVWNSVIATIDDHPISVGTVIVGVMLLFCGFVLARMLSKWFGRRLRTGRLAMDESGASALQTLSFYVLLVCFTLTALRFVNLPLTIFTLFGGAIAIGVGFGSQNIINNFISGLILLAERPIKVGDLIKLDDEFGNVEAIGARSTRIRTGQNLEVIVPNSKFLENNVVNLTLGDDLFRSQVNVGIAYGSPTRDAARLMKHAAVEHGRILKNPEPFVWFADFGDNSLLFELHFWVTARTVAARRRIESDLRFRIDNLFREAGITIAFPQRDVHIDTTSPLAIKLSPEDLTQLQSQKKSNAA